MTIAIHEEAKKEFTKAFAYYEMHQENLGHKFSDEYNSSLDQILAFPEAWPPFIKEGYRRKLLYNFPLELFINSMMNRKSVLYMQSCTCIESRTIGRAENFRPRGALSDGSKLEKPLTKPKNT